jgi:hypothetical protein
MWTCVLERADGFGKVTLNAVAPTAPLAMEVAASLINVEIARKRSGFPRGTATEMPETEDQSRAGVRVIVRRWSDGSTVVDADCKCLGYPGRVHSTQECPVYRRARI